MSTIDRLSIQGIRSFRPEAPEIIKFDTPLTLIVGQNGSGKTTIIECLKYATTGQLPPNSKNGAFIHDPSLLSQSEVLGQVKLMFRNAGGAKLIASRSMSLTQKKATRVFKTVDCVLTMHVDGEKTTVSKAVSKLNESLQGHLGVSEAVLDSVIFCHQDESLWPMSEPGTLKKKFDEIFEAGKYTKAIDKIKKMGKAQKAELGKQKIIEDYTKADKERASASELLQEKLGKEIEKLSEKAEEMTKEMQTLREASKVKQEERQGYQDIIDELRHKKLLREDNKTRVAQLEDDLTTLGSILKDPDDVLELRLAQAEARKGQFEAEEAQLEQEFHRISRNLEQCRPKLDEKLALQGRYLADQDTHEKQLEARVKLVKSSARKHGIRGYEGSIEDHHIAEFLDKLGKASREKKRELQRVIEENSEAFGKANSAVTELVERRSLLESTKKNAKDRQAQNENKIKHLMNEMQKIRADVATKSTLDSECEEIEKLLQAAQIEFAEKQWVSNISKEEERLQDLNAEVSRLSKEQSRISKLQKDHAEVTVREKELKSQQQALKTLVATYGPRITTALGDNWEPENLEQAFKTAFDAKSKAVADAQRLRDGTNTELATIDYRLKTNRENLQKSIAEKTSCEKHVIDSIEDLESVDDFEAHLEGLEDDRNTVKSDIENYSHLEKFYTDSLNILRDKGKCKLCDHHFSDQEEKSVAMRKIEKKLLKTRQEDLAQDLAGLEMILAKAYAARPLYDTHRRLSSEIPKLSEDVKEAESKRGAVLAHLDRQDLEVVERESARNDLESLRSHVSTIVQCASRISGLSQEISRLSSQQKHMGSVSLEEIEGQLDTAREQRDKVASNRDRMRTEKDTASDKINNMKGDLNDSKSRRDNVSNLLERKNEFARQVQSCKDENGQLRETIEQAIKDLDSLGLDYDIARQNLDGVRREGDEKEKTVRDSDADLSMTNDRLQDVDRAIKKYIARGGLTELADCQKECKAIERELKRFEGEISKVADARDAIRDEKAQGEAGMRNYRDNLAYRKGERDLKVLDSEIRQLESQNVTEDARRLEEEGAELAFEHQALNAKRGTVLGQVTAKDTELKRQMDLYAKEFEGAAKKYREAHIKVETTKAAIEDLGKYGAALDQAIMKYHSLKMEEINRIAAELWQSTYQGTDIDTILIRSEGETTAKNRTYNYRVCMVKQDSEMDMRGRCSAGQRVLASIIIRLALAECFGVNCGIIALDEPTTNLDSENIRSLAKSLHDIIEVRKAQKNFQLIVITHDEEFLKAMKCDSFADVYWKVGRNDEQKSTIRQQDIKEVLN